MISLELEIDYPAEATASAVFGAALLLIADSVGRIVIAPAVIQVGVITSFIGAPLFLYLIVKQKKEVW